MEEVARKDGGQSLPQAWWLGLLSSKVLDGAYVILKAT